MKVNVYFQISSVLHKVTFEKINVNSGARRHVESVWHSCLAHEGKNDVQKYPDRCCFDGCLFGYFRANRCCTRRSHCHAICDTDRRPRRQASCNASGHTSCARRHALCAQASSCCRTRCGPCRCTFSASRCCTRTRQSASHSGHASRQDVRQQHLPRRNQRWLQVHEKLQTIRQHGRVHQVRWPRTQGRQSQKIKTDPQVTTNAPSALRWWGVLHGACMSLV